MVKLLTQLVWFDKQKFTFPIKKKKEGTYYLVNFEANSTSVAKMNTTLRLNERVLRFAIMGVEEAQPAQA